MVTRSINDRFQGTARVVLQTHTRSHSDAVGTWSQSGTVITISRTAHGAIVGDNYVFAPTAGTGTLATAGIYPVITTADANTLTLESATSSTGTGTMVGTETDMVLYTGIIPAGTLGRNGSFQIPVRIGNTNNANVKTLKLKIGSTTFVQAATTSQASFGVNGFVQAANSEVIQHNSSGPTGGNAFYQTNAGSSATWTTSTIDFTIDQTFSITVTKATGTDAFVLISAEIILIPSLS